MKLFRRISRWLNPELRRLDGIRTQMDFWHRQQQETLAAFHEAYLAGQPCEHLRQAYLNAVHRGNIEVRQPLGLAPFKPVSWHRTAPPTDSDEKAERDYQDHLRQEADNQVED